MPVRSRSTAADGLFAALANPTRRDILDSLLAGERIAGQLAANFDMARPSVSEHLRMLRLAGLVTERRDGRTVVYAVAPEPLLELRDWLSPYERFWRDRLRGLRSVLDAMDTMDADPDPLEGT
jgi:DNA-binding transcriptional ArsR family regulator